ncbi:related to NADPH-cytochrome P450 reductase (CprA) [Phialocephala subalpina]|uniref:Related to NADPH-cytochrome P450 reductase (CprA) n=1 Tax=Phialocephala subalpina TaxID=576137 RepID=A0A1L7XTB8_9HELO|nr:related to NADPH-cytochrome P450 reductase (CprA) [Phialocephala subalpina]
MPVGKADDAEGATEEDFMAWKASLFTMFRRNLGLEEIEIKYTPTFTVVKDPSLDIIDIHHGEPSHPSDNMKTAAACSPIRALTVQKSKEIFNSAERNCLRMDLDLSEHPDLHYKTGDHLAVWPMNPEAEVQVLLKALGRFNERDVPITIKSLDPTVKVKIQTPTTTSALVRYYLEICAPVSCETILNLAYFAPTAEAKTYLLSLGQDKDVYTDFLTRNYLAMGRILSLASPGSSWTALPVSYLIEYLPHLRPRYYSISSTSVISPRQPSIAALVAKTPLLNAPTQSILGLTSNYLLFLSNTLPTSNTHTGEPPYQPPGPSERLEGGKIFAHIRKSKFKLPSLASRPLVMIATGTGLAPFMALLAERKKLMGIGRPVGEMILFFGCRNPAEDYIYRAELEEMEKLFGGKLRLVTAFSRVSRESRVYTQDRIVERSKTVLGLVEEGANICICGRANIAKDVERAISEAMIARKG